MKLEITEKETKWVQECCGDYQCALLLPNGKYQGFEENHEGRREFIDGEFDTPEKAIDTVTSLFS